MKDFDRIVVTVGSLELAGVLEGLGVVGVEGFEGGFSGGVQ